MKIGIIGATGKIGKCIFREALKRGHDVTAIIRDASKVATPDLQLLVKDAFTLTKEDVETFDVVVNAFGTTPTDSDKHIELTHYLLAIFEKVPTRLITIGTAGSLYITNDTTTRVVDSAKLPAILKQSFLAQTLSLTSYEKSDTNWTYVSPAVFFDASGSETGRYELGSNYVIYNTVGDSYISYYDLALAVVDEIEQQHYVKKQMTAVAEMGKRSFMARLTNKTFQRILK